MDWAASETSFLLWPINEPTSCQGHRHFCVAVPRHLPLRQRLSWRGRGGLAHIHEAQRDREEAAGHLLVSFFLFLKLLHRSLYERLLSAACSLPCGVGELMHRQLPQHGGDSDPHCGTCFLSSFPPLVLMASFPAWEQMEANE